MDKVSGETGVDKVSANRARSGVDRSGIHKVMSRETGVEKVSVSHKTSGVGRKAWHTSWSRHSQRSPHAHVHRFNRGEYS